MREGKEEREVCRGEGSVEAGAESVDAEAQNRGLQESSKCLSPQRGGCEIADLSGQG